MDYNRRILYACAMNVTIYITENNGTVRKHKGYKTIEQL